MDITDISHIKKTLKAFDAHSKKSLGQHFLIDKKALETIVEAADLNKRDRVIEVGPGMGILTQELCGKAKEVLAIELDPAMVAVLKTSCIKCNNLRVLNQDVLQFDSSGIGQYKVVSNVPYYITSAIIKLFLESENKPEEMVLLVQREVAERICAKPSRMSTLSVAVQFYGNPQIVAIVPRSSFFPAPKVDSAIIKIKVYKKPLFNVNSKLFFKIIRAGFAEKRKQIENSLSHSLCIPKEETIEMLKEAGIKPEARAETLSMKDWYNLYKVYVKLLSKNT